MEKNSKPVTHIKVLLLMCCVVNAAGKWARRLFQSMEVILKWSLIGIIVGNVEND